MRADVVVIAAEDAEDGLSGCHFSRAHRQVAVRGNRVGHCFAGLRRAPPRIVNTTALDQSRVEFCPNADWPWLLKRRRPLTWHTPGRRMVSGVAIAAGLLTAAQLQEPGPTASASGHAALGVESHNAHGLDEASRECTPRAGARYGPDAERVALEQRGHQPAVPSDNFSPELEWPTNVQAGQSRAAAPPAQIVDAASGGNWEAAAEDRVRPRDASLSERLVLCRRVAGGLTGGRNAGRR